MGFSGVNCEEILNTLYVTNQGIYQFSEPEIFLYHLRQIEEISIDEMAEKIGYSKSYRCHLFKKELGQTIITYLNSLRISHAKFMLQHYPYQRINEIARDCGFDSPSYFTKKFKEKEGITPEEYRL